MRGQSLQESVQQLIQMHEAWGPKTSTPGASLTLREFDRSGPIVRYDLAASGVPKDVVYSLIAWPVTQKAPIVSMQGVTLDDSGIAVCAGIPGTCSGDGPNDPIHVTLQPIPGEPARLGLVSADGKVRALAKIVPIPLRGEDRGCSVGATLLTPGAEVVLIEGAGFPPNSDMTLSSDSGQEHQGGKGHIDEDGKYTSAILPYRQGATRGVTKVVLESAKCAPSLSFRWGR